MVRCIPDTTALLPRDSFCKHGNGDKMPRFLLPTPYPAKEDILSDMNQKIRTTTYTKKAEE
jgi:hypothetical protein